MSLLFAGLLAVAVWFLAFKMLPEADNTSTIIAVFGILFFGVLLYIEPFTKQSYLYILFILLCFISVWKQNKKDEATYN